MSYVNGQVVFWEETLTYLRSLPAGDYLLQVVNRQKGSKKTHDLYTAVCDLKTMEDKLEEVDVLARYVWANDRDLTPVVYMSNVRIDQVEGYESILRTEAAKLLQGHRIKARALSTTKPAYLGMYRDFVTFDLDVPDKDAVRGRVEQACKYLEEASYEVRLRETSGGFHITVEIARQGVLELRKSLALYGLEDYVDKVGKDVMSPLVGTYQKDTAVKVL